MKAKRCYEHDLQVIAEIHAHSPLDLDTLIRRFQEEMAPIGDPAQIRGNLMAVVERLFPASVEQVGPEAPHGPSIAGPAQVGLRTAIRLRQAVRSPAPTSIEDLLDGVRVRTLSGGWSRRQTLSEALREQSRALLCEHGHALRRENRAA